ELLESEAVQIIGVLAPPAEHARLALRVIAAGRHLLVEKPLCLSLDEADALVNASRPGLPGPVALMGFHMRWHRLVRHARAPIRRRVLGTVDSIRDVWNSPRGEGAFPPWKRTRVTGGGSLVELGVHLVDLWRFLLDSEVVEVTALTRDGAREDPSAALL